MKMLRYYFVGKDLDDLERFEVELEREGIPTERIHVLSLDDTSVENHLKLHDVAALELAHGDAAFRGVQRSPPGMSVATRAAAVAAPNDAIAVRANSMSGIG